MSDRPEKLKEDFLWTKRIQQRLNRLVHALKRTLNAWEKFRSPRGDIGFFSDLDLSPEIARYTGQLPFPDIQEKFENLESHFEGLRLMKGSCDKLSEEVRQPQLLTHPYGLTAHSCNSVSLFKAMSQTCAAYTSLNSHY